MKIPSHRRTGNANQPTADGYLPSELPKTLEHHTPTPAAGATHRPDTLKPVAGGILPPCPVPHCINGLFYGSICLRCGGRGVLVPEAA